MLEIQLLVWSAFIFRPIVVSEAAITSEGAQDFGFNPKVKIKDIFKGFDVELLCPFEKISQKAPTDKEFLDIILWSYLLVAKTGIAGRQWFLIYDELDQRSWQDERDEQVLTTGGDAAGSACHFPFQVTDEDTKKVSHHFTCQNSGREDHTCWCSTTPDFNQGQTWGFCPCAFSSKGVRLLAEGGTSAGELCTFPFRYKGVEYKECTNEHRGGRCWCGTTSDVDADEKWGFCPCAGPPYRGTWGAWGHWTRCVCGELRFRTRPCHPPANLGEIPTGRSVVCPGSKTGVELCSCGDRYVSRQTADLLRLQKRLSTRTRTSSSHSLTISELAVEDSGLYFCNRIKVPSEGPFDQLKVDRLEVFNLNVIDPQLAEMVLLDAGQVPSHQEGRMGRDSVVWHFTDWQSCDRCGILPGEQRKYGFCYTSETIHEDLVGHRLPCRSPLLPVVKRERLAHLATFMLVRRCKSRCPPPKPPFAKVKAKSGNPPKRVTPVSRELFRVNASDPVDLVCPGARPTLPVSWQFDPQLSRGVVVFSRAHKLEQGSVEVAGYVTEQDHLRLKPLGESKSGYYSCFVNGSLDVSYTLLVVEGFWAKLGLASDYAIYFVLSLVVMIVLVVGWGAFKDVATHKR